MLPGGIIETLPQAWIAPANFGINLGWSLLAQIETAKKPLLQETAKTAPPRWLDNSTIALLGIILGLLTAAFITGRVLRAQPETTINPLVVRVFNQRIRAWWMMCATLVAGILLGPIATVVLFGLVSFMGLREFITVTPTRRGDHRSIFWAFFLLTPAQYILVGMGEKYYGLYSILIPVYASLFIPARSAFAGDHKRFLERSAKIQAGLLICVYSLSYAPAILFLHLGSWEIAQDAAKEGARVFVPFKGSNAGLLFYFVLIAQLGDVFQFAWGKLAGRHVIAPAISSSRTWEGLLGGLLTSTLAGALFYWATPFELWESACMALVISLMGFAGGMTMSAIKRDRGVKDYGTLVTGHAGVLDRIDSLCFAAPIFFHLTRLFFTQV